MTRTGLLASLAMFGILGFSGGAAADKCHKVRGFINFTPTSVNCTSPVGYCTAGAVTKAGVLNGTTTFVGATMTPTDNPWAVNYTGTFTITTSHGVLVLQDIGTANFATAGYTEVDVVASSSTGKFEGSTGTLSITGSLAPGVPSTIVGQICFADHSDRDDKSDQDAASDSE